MTKSTAFCSSGNWRHGSKVQIYNFHWMAGPGQLLQQNARFRVYGSMGPFKEILQQRHLTSFGKTFPRPPLSSTNENKHWNSLGMIPRTPNAKRTCSDLSTLSLFSHWLWRLLNCVCFPALTSETSNKRSEQKASDLTLMHPVRRPTSTGSFQLP